MAKESEGKFRKIQEQAESYLDERRIVLTGDERMSPLQRFVHFWMLVIRSFIRNRCPVRASALAYTTLLALIPLLAVGVGVSTSFLKAEGAEPVQRIIDRLVEEVAPQLGLIPTGDPNTEADARKQVAERISEFITRIHSGALGLSGTAALIVIAIGLLSTIELSFNDIWGVAHGRNWFSRLVQYWAAITLGPLLVVLAMGLTIGGKLEAAQLAVQKWLPFIGVPILEFVSYLAPFVILSGTFMLFYMLMPNTRVNWRAALVGGLVGGLLWNLNSNFNVIFAARVVNTSKIYGPLGVVPVFLIGLYFSWLILLFGAQVSYAFQNRRAYLQEKQAESVNQRGREFAALRMMTAVARHFQAGDKASTAIDLAASLAVPLRLVHQVGEQLHAAGLLVELSDGEKAYLPARPLDQVTFHAVLKAMRTAQGQELATRDDDARDAVRREMERIGLAEQQAGENVTLQDFINRLPVGQSPSGATAGQTT